MFCGIHQRRISLSQEAFMNSVIRNVLKDYTSKLLKGLRPVLEGFVVPMHEGACETGSQIPRATPLTYYSHKRECIGTTNPDRSVLITIITWHFQFHPVNVSNLRVKGAYVLEARAGSRAPPIATSRGAP